MRSKGWTYGWRVAGLAVFGALGWGHAAAQASTAIADDATITGVNTRLFFDDSSGPGFPDNDWALVANDTTAGGRDMFAIRDSTAGIGIFPFLVTAGAPNNAFFMDSTGDVGLGTDDPILDFQINTSNTPGIRLEQNNGGGFTPQTWDVAGNEANFFIRDVTNGSRLPFRIRPGAPTSSVDISATGKVGITDSSPDAPLNVERSDGTAKILVEETGGTGRETLLDLDGNTSALARFARLVSPGVDEQWLAGIAENGEFTISTGTAAETKLALGRAGDLSLEGSIGQLGTAASQANPTPVDQNDLLAKLRALPISTYKYAADPAGLTHIGPTAADFNSGFGFGNANYLGLADMAGVALATDKALDQRLTTVEGLVGGGGGVDLSALEARVASAEKKAAKATKKAKKAIKQVKALRKELNR